MCEALCSVPSLQETEAHLSVYQACLFEYKPEPKAEIPPSCRLNTQIPMLCLLLCAFLCYV